MSIDGGIKLLDALTGLLRVVLWPGVVLFLFMKFGPTLKEFLANFGEFSFKGAGFQASLKRSQIAVAAELGAAEVTARFRNPGSSVAEDAIDSSSQTVSDIVKGAVTRGAIRRAQNARLLWVDDRPRNNSHEKRALEALGIDVIISTTTEDALQKLGEQHFDVIISDMDRPGDVKAGYTLLEKLRTAGDRTHFIIYSTSGAPKDQREAKRKGAFGCTNRPSELIEMVLDVLTSPWEPRRI